MPKLRESRSKMKQCSVGFVGDIYLSIVFIDPRETTDRCASAAATTVRLETSPIIARGGVQARRGV